MNLTKKILKIFVIAVLLIPVILMIKLIIVGFIFGYNESPNFKNSLAYYPIKDSLIHQLKNEGMFINKFNDTVLFFSKGDNNMFVWKIEQFNNLDLDSFVICKRSNPRQKNFYTYININTLNPSSPEINSKVFLKSRNELQISFSGDTIIVSRSGGQYLLYSSFSDRISLITKKNYLVIDINFKHFVYSNLLFFKSKRGFYLICQSSANIKDMDPDQFIRMLIFQ